MPDMETPGCLGGLLNQFSGYLPIRPLDAWSNTETTTNNPGIKRPHAENDVSPWDVFWCG